MRVGEYERSIDPLLGELLTGGNAEQVVARLADERDFGSEPCRRYGLVGAFPARVHQERAAQNGLSGSRQMVRLDDHVGVRAADHQDFAGFWRSAIHVG